MKNIVFLLFFVITGVSYAQNQLLINEASSRNDQAIMDEDGDDSDWIEIYNNGVDPIQLSDYYLSDDKDVPFMWQFPELEIEPGAYLIVFASGKNRTQTIHHWETPLNGDSLWKYLNPIGQSEYDYLMWTEPEFNDDEWEWARGAFGTGYENIETESSDQLPCIYLRNEFYLSDTSQVLAMTMHAYFDDGFTVFLNGYEILREHMLHNGIKPGYGMTAFPSHASIIDSGDPPQRFDIEPIIWKNLIKNGRNVLALQNHNFWDHFPLVIKPWLSIAIADTIVQTDSLAENLSTPNLPLHANFKINADGEKIYLFKKNGEMIQKMEVPNLKADHSYGFHPQWTDSLVLFQIPTPGSINTNSTFIDYLKDSCNLISPSGFYQDSVLIQITQPDPALKAYYTLDGSLPDTNSYRYESAFYIDSSLVFRIQYFSDSLLDGPISNYSYFINDSSTLEVVSIITDPENLWDDETGIYVKGNQYWNEPPFFEANFWQNWEKPVQIQHFDTEHNLIWQQNAGIKIHGNWTRMLPQKSLGFYAKSKYGKSTIDQQLFIEKPFIEDSKRFLLRNAGNDNILAHMRDLLIHRRMAETHIDVQQGYPVSSYLNGEYWGVYHLREKIDRYYLERNNGVNPDEVNLLEQNGLIINGDRNGFESLVEYITTYDLEENQHYHYIAEQIDIANWIDLYIANLYHFNTDWPHHNSKFWKAPHQKWQQILVDLDVSMRMYSWNAVDVNPLPNIHEDTISYLAIFYKELLKNGDFERAYANRFADLMNTIFLATEYLPLFDSLKAEMAPEMQRHCERWNKNYPNWMDGYYTENVRNFINDRNPFMRAFLRERYELGAYDTIMLSVEPEGKGYIKLNTLQINENQWQGLYYDSIAVRIEAVPNPGYEFVRWESPTSPGLADSSRVLENYYLDTFDDITAIFFSPTGTEDTLQIAISEINYRDWENAPTGDWIEIYNRESDTVDLSNWKLMGNKPYKTWNIPENTTLPPSQFVVLVQDTNLFKKWHPHIPFVGPFQFEFEEDKLEQISIYDDLDRLVNSMIFSPSEPWPDNSESARTIELTNIHSDFHSPENWQLGCPGGSPGLLPQNCEKTTPITITEINYNSHPNYETGDWIEILNKGEESLDLSHYLFMDSNPKNAYQIEEGLHLESHEKLIILQDTALFFSQYKDSAKWLGPFNFGLSSNGEIIKLQNPFAQTILEMEYQVTDPWPVDAGNNGKSIELADTTLNMQLGENWIANCFLGTPWQEPEWCVQAPSIWISEVKYQSAPDSMSGDWIELYNSNERVVNLLNWQLIIHGDTLIIDTSYTINADDYVVLIADSSAFYSVYDSTVLTLELDHFDLRKEEDAIAILDPYRFPGKILNYNYLLNWPVVQSDTNNRTLELVNYSNTYFPENWRASCDFGTPGLPPSYCNTDGIGEVDNSYDLRVNPNPTSSNLQLRFYAHRAEILHLYLYDNLGNMVLEKPINLNFNGQHTITLDVQRFPVGLYLLQLIGENQSAQTKIIKIEE